MLTKLRIQNFKAWKDTGEIRLAPITVFFGANSAGKTSLLQFLLMLKQTAESPDRRRVLHPGDDRSLVELGTFEDLIFEHDPNLKLEFEVAWVLPKTLRFNDPLKGKSYQGDEINFSANLASVDDTQVVNWLDYKLRRETGDVAVSVRMARRNSKSVEYELSAEGYDLVRIQGRVWPLPSPTRFYGFPDEVPTRYQNAAFTNDLALALEQQLERLTYLGPLRDVPNRIYAWAGDYPEHVGRNGEGTVAALLAGAKREFSLGYKKKAHPFQEVIARWLKQLGLLDSFKARKLAAGRKQYEIRVRTKGGSGEVDLPDVGFGISQVLPVVVECFYVKRNSTVIIEQPELHLHPRVQSELADLFIEAIRTWEKGEPRSIQFIVESHSEHFLQRLQRRIAEGDVKTTEVALYFCESDAHGSKLRPLEVNLYGEIVNWPDEFFGDPMQDLSKRMEAAAQKESEPAKQ
ncbi:MAG TPA: DUF3696 domain-containing protein [Terriglobia bacterium]|nr:DUF3696 domain-containing protein [Terriglobia bacterium]